MRDADRDGLALLDGAVLAGLDVGGDLDGAAVEVEEAEAVAAAGGLQRAGLADDLHAALAEVLGERVDGRPVSAPNAIRSSRFSSDWRSRTTYCSGEPSAAKYDRPLSVPCSVRPQVSR